MKKKIPWLVVTCLMVLSLILASCAPTVAPEEEEVVTEEEVVVEEEEEAVVAPGKETTVDAMGRTVEKPRYGGVLVYCMGTPIIGFDEVHGVAGSYRTQKLTQGSLLIGDFLAGPAGYKRTGWNNHNFPAFTDWTGEVAEKWEFIDEQTMVFWIRKGMHFAPADKAPTYGRELTAEDVVFSLKRSYLTDTSYLYHAYPWDIYVESIEQESWEGSDPKYTVVIRSKPGKLGFIFEMVAGHSCKIVPKDAIEYYGDFGNWQDTIGTGPFMITDYVPDSSVTLVRNPNYWGYHPMYPDMKMPFPDGIKFLIIQDVSTRMTALRTGKIDLLCEEVPYAIEYDDMMVLKETAPQLKLFEHFLGRGQICWYRVDNPDTPLYDVKVRKALNMAADNQEILDTVFNGKGVLLYWPVAPFKTFMNAYIPLEELPESAREGYEYHPDKAKALMEEAGYPNGFATSVICCVEDVDQMSILAAKWKEHLNVDLTIDVKEYGIYNSIKNDHTYRDMIVVNSGGTFWYKFMESTPGNKQNYAMINDPVIEEKRIGIINSYWDQEKRAELMKDLYPHMLEQNFAFFWPGPLLYNACQPWIRDYRGERSLGYIQRDNIVKWLWVDQEMKAAMGR